MGWQKGRARGPRRIVANDETIGANPAELITEPVVSVYDPYAAEILEPEIVLDKPVESVVPCISDRPPLRVVQEILALRRNMKAHLLYIESYLRRVGQKVE